MKVSRINKSTEQSFWVSALYNRTLLAAMQVSHPHNQRSMHVLCDRLAEYLGVKATCTSFTPVYNPQDKSQWPELLGWLVTIAEQETVELN